jgi:hypothetical protein
MHQAATLELSAVIPFSDDEDVIGTAVRRTAAHLRELGLSFEILAIDEGCRDNSHAVLGLLRADIPELRIGATQLRGRGVVAGASQARGRVLWLLDPQAALAPMAPLGRAYRRVARNELDVVVVDQRFAVSHRTRAMSAVEGLRTGNGLHRRLVRRSRARKLRVETYSVGGSRAQTNRVGERPWSRILGALAPARFDRTRW